MSAKKKNGNENKKSFRNTVSDINVKDGVKKKRSHKQTKKWFRALSQTQNIFSRCRAFGLRAIWMLGPQTNGVHSPLSERKRNATLIVE